MRIGLIGEAPNDTTAIANLLKKRFDHQYIPILNRIKGDQIENKGYSKLLKSELQTKTLDVLIFIRDLDGFESEDDKIQNRMRWFNENKVYFDGPSLFLLNIHELEAIFFADVDSLNKLFKLKLKFKNPVFVVNPKEELKRVTTNKYHENRASEYITHLDYDVVLAKYKPLKEIDNFLNQ
jgi:hypothetical protein